MIETLLQSLIEALNKNTEAVNSYGPVRSTKLPRRSTTEEKPAETPAPEAPKAVEPPAPTAPASVPEPAPAPTPPPAPPAPVVAPEAPKPATDKVTLEMVKEVANHLIEWDAKNDMAGRPGRAAILEFNAQNALQKLSQCPEDKYLDAVKFLRAKLEELLSK